MIKQVLIFSILFLFLKSLDTIDLDSVLGDDFFDCDMENDTSSVDNCFLEQDKDDDLDWTLGSAKTPSGFQNNRKINEERFPITGPVAAYSGTSYIYMETSGTKGNQTARLFFDGAQFINGGIKCLSFYFDMNGFHVGKLLVFKMVENKKIVMWELVGDKGSGWMQAAIDIDIDGNNKFGIEATTAPDGGVHGDISIDELQISEGYCQEPPSDSLWACNFETNSNAATTCDLENLPDSDFPWTLSANNTPTANTGPSSAYSGTYFLHIEASNRNLEDEAGVLLPNLKVTDDLCLEFYSHMHGFHIGSLEILIYDGTTKQKLWGISGNKGDEWYKQNVNIDALEENERIMIKGKVDGGVHGDIAIDDMKVKRGKC